MSVGSKNSERLAALEEEFLARLTAELERVSSGANTLFFSPKSSTRIRCQHTSFLPNPQVSRPVR